MLKQFNFKDFVPQVLDSFQAMKETTPFIVKNKLWRGILDNKWVATFSIIISILFTYYLFKDIGQFVADVVNEDVALAGLGLDMDELTKGVKEEGKSALFTGGSKYLLIIFMEVIIFSFTVKTFSILTNGDNNITFRDFVEAEKRMIIVMVRNFIQAAIAHLIIYICLSIVGVSDLTSFVMFFVYAYFLGFAFLDNYNEQFEKPIKESQLIIRQHVGASTALGVLASGLIFIPLVGPIFMPIVVAIAATIYGTHHNIQNDFTESVSAP